VPEATAERVLEFVADEAGLSVNEVLDAYPDFEDIWRRTVDDVLWDRKQDERIRSGLSIDWAIEALRRYHEDIERSSEECTLDGCPCVHFEADPNA